MRWLPPGTRLAHCPLINQFRGAIAPVGTMLDRGVTVGLGIDNYFSDFFDLIRSSIAVARIRADDPEVMQAPQALALATIDSARAIGLGDRIGSIEPGKQADLQIVDMRRLGLTPVTDPIRTLVYHAHAKDVETVLVDGRVLVRDGTLLRPRRGRAGRTGRRGRSRRVGPFPRTLRRLRGLIRSQGR